MKNDNTNSNSITLIEVTIHYKEKSSGMFISPKTIEDEQGAVYISEEFIKSVRAILS